MQYTSFALGHRPRETGIAPSMGGCSWPSDSTRCESFFASPETEVLDRVRFVQRESARCAL